MPEFFTVASQKLLQKDLKIGPFLDGLSLTFDFAMPAEIRS